MRSSIWLLLFVLAGGCGNERSFYEAKPAPTSKTDPYYNAETNPTLDHPIEHIEKKPTR
jgi:hypothetical protein